MEKAYPYVASPGPLVQTIEQFRKKFPPTVDSDTLKSLSLAPKNESLVINVLKFLEIVGADGKKNDENIKPFFGNDEEFQLGLEVIVRNAYSAIFDTIGDDAWAATTDKLIGFFRQKDSSSELVGKRKAKTFLALAGLSGKNSFLDGNARGSNSSAREDAVPKIRKKAKVKKEEFKHDTVNNSPKVELAVRVEINLPASPDQDVYDAIFKSLRQNLINHE